MKLPTALLVASATLTAAEFKAGVARIDISPEAPIYLSGYAGRTSPAPAAKQKIAAKALAIEDKRGARVVIVTTDLIGLPRSISDVVAARARKEYGIERSRLVLNSSHTHTGPLLLNNLNLIFDLGEEDMASVRRYSETLTGQLVSVVGAALKDMQPAELRTGHGEAGFGMNRRVIKNGPPTIGVNPSGPTDHDVPVLQVLSADGKVRAVLFLYACHNTTLTGAYNEVNGDYAGYAQEGVEKALPGATALFIQGCGGDQNPEPRGTLDMAQRNGKSLADAVVGAVNGGLQPVRGDLKSAFQTTDLRFQPHTRQQFEARLQETNVYRVRHARYVLRTYDEGHPMRSYPYPVQAVAIGKSFTLLALGGEVVIDYVHRVKKEYGAKGIMVAGYSNDVMGYIPSARVLKEGGYEGGDSMIYYGPPGPWEQDVEDRIFSSIHSVMKKVGKKK